MNPALVLSIGGVNKRLIALVIVTLVVILSLPVMAVFSLGGTTLKFLSGSLSTSDSTIAISATTIGLYEGPEVKGDSYAWGNCTYWVYALRLSAGDPIPTTWGNANTWAIRAAKDGYTVDNTPAVNAIMQTSRGKEGHVAYVTTVDPVTGNWTISEMNVKGFDVIDIQTYSSQAAASYNFIHDKAL